MNQPLPRTARDKGDWIVRYSLKTAIAIALILPLFFGGKNDFALAGVKIWLFALSLAISIAVAITPTRLSSFRRPRRIHLMLAILFCSLVVFQFVPLPRGLMNYLSPRAVELYSYVGSSSFFLSLEPATTFSGLAWVIALFLSLFWLTSLPYETKKTSISSSPRKRLSVSNSVLRIARQTDRIADILQRSIVWVGVICSIIAISHWAFRSEYLLGIFDPGRGHSRMRAHYPFVNPDHLSVLLEIAIMTTFARLLRNTQLRILRGRGEHSDNLALALLKSPSQLEAQLPYLVALLTMILCNVLALSRGGNLLTLVGLGALWWMFSRLPLRPMRTFPTTRKRGRDEHKRHSLFHTKTFIVTRRIFALLFSVFVVLFFLGQTGRDFATKRLEYGLAQGFDQSRAMLNSTSLKVISEYPLLGVGLGCWHLAAARYIPKELAGWKLDYAHNEYLQLLAETGIVGGALAAMALISICVLTLRAWRKELMPTQRLELFGSGLAITLPLLHSMFDFPFHMPALAYFYVIALVVHLRFLTRALSPELLPREIRSEEASPR